MKIKGKIRIKTSNAPELVNIITKSLEPDNLSSITTEYKEDLVTTYFISEKIGSLIASVDDYLMNAKIAGDMIITVNKDPYNEREDNVDGT
ncbi:MAG: hypothetical protein KAJ93_06535 [Methanosarcinales archaeon]|nr:hypothetical protein [Methanosarcinales archaeon]